MSLAIVHSRARVGVRAPEVRVEVHLAGGLPSMSIVGLPEAAVREAKDRVRAAIQCGQFEFPARRITVNLAPADLPKDGGRYDLAIALSAWGFDAEGHPDARAIAAFRRGYESVRPLTPAEAEALPRLGEAAALRFTLTRLHDRIFHDPSKLVTPKDPAVFLRRLDGWRALEAVA